MQNKIKYEAVCSCLNKYFLHILRNHWVDLIELNLIFLLFSLPIVTIPASLMSLENAIFQMQRDEYTGIVQNFIRKFRDLLLKSWIPGLFLILGCGICVAGIFFLHYTGRSAGTVFLLAMVLIIVYIFISVCRFVFVQTAILELPMISIFRNAVILSFSEVWANIAETVIMFLLNFLIVLTMPYTFPILLLFHISFCELISVVFARNAISRCIL